MQRTVAITILTFSSLAAADPHELDARYTKAIHAAATAYAKWGRVDERPNLAPTLCRAPLPQDYGAPSHVQLSSAEDGPHAQKLYYLWASDRRAYLALGSEHEQALPVGFSIVKQSFSTKQIASKPPELGAHDFSTAAPAPISWLEHDGKLLATDRPRDLFVMTKVAASDAAGTDDGWVYGTVAPDGSVTSAGRVSRCMGCHEDATHERLFGFKGRQ